VADDAPDDPDPAKLIVSTSMAVCRFWRQLAVDGSVRPMPLSFEEGQSAKPRRQSKVGGVRI